MKTTLGLVKINLRQSKIAYIIAGIGFIGGAVQAYILPFCINATQSGVVAPANYLYLLPLCVAIFIPALNFTKLMNLGGKRMDFFIGSILTYAPIALLVSMISVVLNLTADRYVSSTGKIDGILDLLDVFGFMDNGPVVACIQMFVFLTMFACVLHTLTLVQDRWYGWVIDVIIVAVISVFTPIAPLRAALVWFFTMIIFHHIAIVQILSCIVLGTVVYALSLILVRSKQL